MPCAKFSMEIIWKYGRLPSILAFWSKYSIPYHALNTMFDLTGPKFEPPTSRSRDERATARLTGRYISLITAKSKSNLSLYTLYYIKACNKFGVHLRVIVPGQHSSFRNVTAVASRLQHCVWFDRPEIWTLDLPLQGRTSYRFINCATTFR